MNLSCSSQARMVYDFHILHLGSGPWPRDLCQAKSDSSNLNIHLRGLVSDFFVCVAATDMHIHSNKECQLTNKGTHLHTLRLFGNYLNYPNQAIVITLLTRSQLFPVPDIHEMYNFCECLHLCCIHFNESDRISREEMCRNISLY